MARKQIKVLLPQWIYLQIQSSLAATLHVAHTTQIVKFSLFIAITRQIKLI